jgi:hypothetical protein
MANNALYFPYIDLPQNRFTNTALLYWNQVITIAPWGTEHELTPENQNDLLIRHDAIRQLHPESYSNNYPNFGRRFIELIDDLNFDQVYPNKGGWARSRDAVRTASRIHTSKVLTFDLGRMLIDRGLVLERETDGPWLMVEPITAELFMMYLSQCLAQDERLDCFPVTDEPFKLQMIGAGPKRRVGFSRILSRSQPVHETRHSDSRFYILNRILPATVDLLDAEQILEIRSKRHDTRLNFRKSIEAFINEELPHAHNERDRNSLIEDFVIRKNEEIKEIQRQLSAFSKTKPQRIGFAALGIATTALAAADLLHGGIALTPTAALGAIGFGGTMLYAARNAVKDYREGAPELKKDMAFAALLRQP